MRKRYQLLNVDVDVDQQEKALLWTTAHTQDPQGTVSSVVLEMKKRILQWLKEIKNLLKQHVPKLLEVFKMRSLLVWFALLCLFYWANLPRGKEHEQDSGPMLLTM